MLERKIAADPTLAAEYERVVAVKDSVARAERPVVSAELTTRIMAMTGSRPVSRARLRVGGHLAGRLRTKSVGVHDHEVFFRDTAHGFVTWAVATGVVAIVLASSLSSLVGAGTQAASAVAAGVVHGAAGAASQMLDPNAYFIDRLFRSASIAAAPASAAAAWQR